MKHDSRCDHTNYLNESIMLIQNLCRSSLSSFDPFENTRIIIIIHQTRTSSTLIHFYEKDGLLHSYFCHKYDISVSDSGEVYHSCNKSLSIITNYGLNKNLVFNDIHFWFGIAISSWMVFITLMMALVNNAREEV